MPILSAITATPINGCMPMLTKPAIKVPIAATRRVVDAAFLKVLEQRPFFTTANDPRARREKVLLADASKGILNLYVK